MEKENAQLGALSDINQPEQYNTTSGMSTFNNSTFGDLSVVIDEEAKPWFVGGEVAEKLGYKNIHDALNRFCPKKKLTRDPRLSFSSHFGQRGILLIPESDLYRLTMKSTRTEAETFQDWVCEEVIPSIREHGGYTQGQESMTPEELMAKAVLVAESQIQSMKLENERLSNAITDLTSQLVAGVTIPAFCMQLNGVNTQEVQGALVKQGILIKERHGYRPSSPHRNKEFECTSYEYQKGKRSYTTLITPVGVNYLYRLYRKGKLPMRKDWNGSHTTNQVPLSELKNHQQ